MRELTATKKDIYEFGCYAYPRRADRETAEYKPLGGSNTEACANCLFFISPNNCTVVDPYPDYINPTGISKFWTAIPDPAMRPLEVVIVDGDGGSSHRDEDKATKQATKTEDGVEYKAADYAVVPDDEKSSTWKLRLAEERSGNFTVAQVARAITAMQPSGFRGQKVEFGAGEKAEAVRKIGAAIGKSGGTDDQKDNLRTRLNGVKDAGPLRRFIAKYFEPVPEPVTSGMQFEKTADGIRWIAWASNNFRDRDNPPEILEEKAHQEFVEYLADGGAYPELWMWHVPGSKWGEADWADYVDGFLVVSGMVDSGMADVAEATAADPGLGVSHGFTCAYSDKANGIIGQYRTYEISPLPLKEAANPWTNITVLLKEATKMMHANQRAFLVDKLGEDRVAAIEADTENWGKALAALGIEAKEIPAPVPDTVANSPRVIAAAVADGLVDTDKAVPLDIDTISQAMVKAMAEAPQLKAMVDSVKAQGDRIDAVVLRLDALEESEDKKIAAVLTPRVAASIGIKGASASENNVKAAAGVREELAATPEDDMVDIFAHLVEHTSQGAVQRKGAS